MIDSKKIQAWATPLTIGAFALSAITGVMIFFHLNSGLIKVVHEWFSWLLVIGGLFHVIASWRPFKRYFSKPSAKAIMAVFALLVIMAFLPLGGGHDKEMMQGRLSGLLHKSPFSAIASAAGHEPDALIKELGSKGIVIQNSRESIRQIAMRNNRRGAEILDLIF